MNSLLKNAREQKNLKTRELAQLIGIDQALVSKFENGTRKPTKGQVKKLAEVLNESGALYTTHLRTEFDEILAALDEAFEIWGHLAVVRRRLRRRRTAFIVPAT